MRFLQPLSASLPVEDNPGTTRRLLESYAAIRSKNRDTTGGMEWLNYHHLFYFWVVAKEGSIAQASKELRLAHPTISAQIHRLEDVLGDQADSP